MDSWTKGITLVDSLTKDVYYKSSTRQFLDSFVQIKFNKKIYRSITKSMKEVLRELYQYYFFRWHDILNFKTCFWLLQIFHEKKHKRKRRIYFKSLLLNTASILKWKIDYLKLIRMINKTHTSKLAHSKSQFLPSIHITVNTESSSS